MKNKIGIAVIGLGFVGGRAHVPALKKIPDAELVAVVDLDEQKVNNLARKYNIRYHYSNYEEALKNPEVDAVVVAVPTPFHYEIVSKAIAFGKHILCEMPITNTIEKTIELGNDAAKAGIILMPDLNFRFTPNYVKAKELLSNGFIGQPLTFTYEESIPAKVLAAQWPLGSWAWNIKRSGGYPDFTLSLWSIDLARWLLETEIEDSHWMSQYTSLSGIHSYIGYNTMGTIRFSNNAVGVLRYSSTVSVGQATTRLEIFGNNTRTLKAEGNNQLVLTGEDTTQEWTFREKGAKVWGHYQTDSHFIQSILQEKKPIITIEDAIKAHTVADEIAHNARQFEANNSLISAQELVLRPTLQF